MKEEVTEDVKQEAMEAKQEVVEPTNNYANHNPSSTINGNNVVVAISDSSSSSNLLGWNTDSDSDYSDKEGECNPRKKQRILTNVLPVGFLDPLRPEERLAMQQQEETATASTNNHHHHPQNGRAVNPLTSLLDHIAKEEPLALVHEDDDHKKVAIVGPVFRNERRTSRCVKQFWKAGDFYDASHDASVSASGTVGMDHVRVHPKFLHSNSTSHKWALGAFAELLDNALDEVSNGATYVHIDMLKNSKDNNAVLLVEDNGGGMTPDRIRQCMSLGYSAKSKLANTIGQYGNGFKTSTMRLGADVIVFSRCRGKDGRSATQSIGMLSYTFLRETGKEDIVVPMIDYEKRGEAWYMMIRSTSEDWNRNLDTILQWSPCESEEDLLLQFDYLEDQGTRIIVYNLWEDDQGSAELDFDSDKYDIQIRGVNRDEKKIEMAKNFPNLKHYLTYRHSLRNYAAILYLRIPPGFRIILRGKDVEHYNIINDLKYSKEITYRPQGFPDEAPKDPNMRALLTIGFIKDANYHIDVQGFNVYHKNRLIKPFWRVWNAAGSDGRGVIGVLEANFVEPAHDKQGFERTIVFSRLENRLVAIQKDFWSSNCHLVGYAKRRDKNSVPHEGKTAASPKAKLDSASKSKAQVFSRARSNIISNGKYDDKSPAENAGEIGTAHDERQARNEAFFSSGKTQPDCVSNQKIDQVATQSELVTKLKEENKELKTSLEDVLHDLQYEKDRNKSLENKIQEVEQKLREINRGTEEEMHKRDLREEALRNKAMVAADVIEELRNKINLLEGTRTVLNCKREFKG